MKPIAILQHTKIGAPGAVVSILESLGRKVHLVKVFDTEPIPVDASAFAGLVFLGGSMGVHDPLPWIALELELIRQADNIGLPIAGHCLGSQLVALALGGIVRKHGRPEIGWGRIQPELSSTAYEWWGRYANHAIETFQWHQDTFVPPAGAERIATNEHCENQVFVIRDRHLLVQSHLEMTPDLVERTFKKNHAQLERQLAQGNPAAQRPDEMLQDLASRTRQMNKVLLRLYTRWIRDCSD